MRQNDRDPFADGVVTVRSALELPALKRGVPEVIAGHDALDRPIRWVHTSEVPDVASLLKGGELLLTTGMGIGTTAAEQRTLVEQLARRGIAGIVLELGTSLATTPAAFAAACGTHRIPLVVLHRGVPFIDVTEAIHAELVNARFALMEHGETVQHRFTELMLGDAGVPELLDALADLVGNPVVLELADGSVAYHAAHELAQRDLVPTWEACLRQLPSAPPTIEHPVPTGEGADASGRLVALGVQRELDRFDALALERAAPLVGLTLQRAGAGDATAVRERGNFLAEVVNGAIGENEAAERAASFGFAADWLLAIAVGRRTPARASLSAERDLQWSKVWRDVRRELKDLHAPALLGGAGAQTLIVLGLSAPTARQASADRVASLIATATQRHLGSPRAAVVCASRPVATWGALADAIDHALAAIPAATHARERDWHDAEAPDVDRLLWSLRGDAELRAFVEGRLGPVLEHDRRRSAKLLPTLEALCAHGGRKAATARELHLERPSLYHRIARLEELLGGSLSDADTFLGVHLALRARRHLRDAA
ncbi:MAG: PucR family transcriptional regulator [Conexibacter sp.]